MTLIHDTFTLDRTYDSTVAEVWHAWSDPELRARWFHGPEGWQLLERRLDLRAGGSELLRGRTSGGVETLFVSTFHVVVPERHVVSAYDMHVAGALISVTLASVELEAAGESTRLRYVEQGTYLDGNSEAPLSRKHGTAWHLDNLAKLLRA